MMTDPTILPAAPARAPAGRRNMTLLIQLRWLAVGGQLATIGVVSGPMGISLPRAPLLGALLVLIAHNFARAALLPRGRGVTTTDEPPVGTPQVITERTRVASY